MNLITLYSTVSFIAYLSATLAILTRLFHPKGPNQKLTIVLSSIALIAHTLFITKLMFSASSDTAVNFNLLNVISLVALLIALSISAIALKFKANLLLPVVYGFSGLWLMATPFIPPTVHLIPSPENFMLVTHIVIALVAYCILIIATLYAFQVNYINFKLKSKNIAVVSHLPPLMQVQQQLFLILAIGTLCLLLSQITGFLFLENHFSKENAHKTILSLSALLVYCITLWGHYKKGWRGHKVLVLTMLGSSLLTLAYFGSRFVKEFILS